jgi:hypothetical protein
VRPPRPARAELARRAVSDAGRTLVLCRGHQLRDEDQQHDLPRGFGVPA